MLLFDRKLRAGEGICPRLHSYQVAESGFEPRPADSCLHACVEHQLYARSELDIETVKQISALESLGCTVYGRDRRMITGFVK